jgi:hypothetical protein
MDDVKHGYLNTQPRRFAEMILKQLTPEGGQPDPLLVGMTATVMIVQALDRLTAATKQNLPYEPPTPVDTDGLAAQVRSAARRGTDEAIADHEGE